MKTKILSLPVMAVLLTSVVLVCTAAQAPQGQSAPQQPPAPLQQPPTPRSFPAPTNLQVLPKNLTGDQVHEIMEQWESELGGHCSTCHTPDPKNIGPNGKPRLNFADDSKPEKATARKMYLMMTDINEKYIAKIDSSGMPINCGTCHRGHVGPEPFIAPVKDHDHDHAGPPPPPPAAPQQ